MFWKILTFASDTESRSPTRESLSGKTFLLVRRFLLLGALHTRVEQGASKESHEEMLQPSISQLESCCLEIDYLSSLLSSGSIGMLPKNDDFFKEIVQRAITLHSDAYVLNAQNRMSLLPTDGEATARADKKALKRIWNNFNPKSSPLFDTAEFSDDVVQFLNKPIVLPSATFLKRFMCLVFAWIRAVPVNKARFTRLTVAARDLSKNIIEKAKEAEKRPGTTGIPDGFALAFAVPEKSEREWRGTYLREAAAYMHMMVAVSIKYRLEALRVEKIVKYPMLAGATEKVRMLNVCKSN